MVKRYAKKELKECLVEESSSKYNPLEERTAKFAKEVYIFLKSIRRTTESIEVIKQLARSSGSVGANYIEANNSTGRKDLAYKIRVCKKEAKESAYWLQLLDVDEKNEKRDALIKEANELVCIFGAILKKVSVNDKNSL